MNYILLSIFVVIVILIFVFCALVLSYLKKKSVSNSEKINEKKTVNIDSLFAELANPRLDHEAIQKIILKFIDTQTLPMKLGKNLSNEAKKKLEFVSAVAAHKNASAKNIAFLSRELSKRYTSYKDDILKYEQIGMAKRSIIKHTES